MGIPVITESDVPSANLRVDFLISSSSPLPSPFHLSRRILVGEFVSVHDEFDFAKWCKGIAKGYLVLAEAQGRDKALSYKDLSIYFVLAGRARLPPFLNSIMMQERAPGLYEHQDLLHFVVILLDLIALPGSTRFLKLFARQEVRRSLLLEALRTNDSFMTTLGLALYRDEFLAMAAAENLSVEPKGPSIREGILWLGMDKVIEAVGMDKVIEAVGMDKVIEALTEQLTTHTLSPIAKDQLRKQLLYLLRQLE